MDKGHDLSLDSAFRVTVASDGSASWTPGFKWKTSCKVDLTFFPFDEQTCSIVFANWVYTGTMVQFVSQRSKVVINKDVFQENGGWQLISTSVADTPITEYVPNGNLSTTNVYPIINVTLALRRRPTFYVNNVIIPGVIFTVMTGAVFFLPSESGEKVSLGTTLLLSYTVLSIMISDITPRTGDTTPLISKYAFIHEYVDIHFNMFTREH